MAIKYCIGDATEPQGAGSKLIAHVCNDEGKWGAGFVLALSHKFPAVEAEYRKLYAAQNGQRLTLGSVQFVTVVPGNLFVANMIGQRGIKKMKDGSTDECPPIRYPALFTCLEELCKFAQANSASIHAPRFGAGLAGGDWRVVEAMLEKICSKAGVDVTIYDLAVPTVGQVVAASADSDII